MNQHTKRHKEVVERVADALEHHMFAPHELPIDAELHRKYLRLARAAIHAMREPCEVTMDYDTEYAAHVAKTIFDLRAENDRLRLGIAHEADRTEAADDEAMRRGHEIEQLRDALEFIDRELSAVLNTWTFEGDEGQALAVIRDKARSV